MLLLLWLGGTCFLAAQTPKAPENWIIPSAPYPAKNDTIPQVVYTDKFRHLTVPEFWISKLPRPDRKILNRAAIRHFNDQTARHKKLIISPEDFNSTYSGEWIRTKLTKLHDFLLERAFYFENGKAIDKNFLEDFEHYSNPDAVLQRVKTRYALVVDYANHRVTPTEATLLKKPEQIYFDRNQNAALDIGTPLAVLHQTADAKWYFALAPTSYGWIRAQDIAFTTRKKMLAYAKSKNFVITVNPKNALFYKNRYDNYLRMGVRLPYVGRSVAYCQVQIPKRNSQGKLELRTATISLADIHRGYLPYTQRTIIKQAFKFLNAPYGWGGMFGEQDCSKFLQEIYATVGIILPRNSGEQKKTGKTLITFGGTLEERSHQLTVSARPASTLLHLPGHIMLYLGIHEGTPYIIHTVWGARKGKDPVAKTAVTSVHFKDYLAQIESATSIK
ncbi:MAG: SH3 domain-containing protein [Campylobacterota bacterium]|nr:SH3 domain-containing protein [Campylobacterota bacterium]